MPISSVWPSGGALATKSVPILPPAPVRFSTITGWPSASASLGARMRAVKSAMPPGGRVAIIRSGLVGQACAGAAVGKSADAAMAASTINDFITRHSPGFADFLETDSRYADDICCRPLALRMAIKGRLHAGRALDRRRVRVLSRLHAGRD